MKHEQCIHSDVTTFGEYIASLSSPIDSFLEDHIFESTFYRMRDGGDEVGHFAVHKGSLLTQFFLRRAHQGRAQPLLAVILKEFEIKSAFAPTCDEFFLGHMLDTDAQMKKQAYFFVDAGAPVPPSIHSSLQYRLAEPSDVDEIKNTSGDFLDAAARGIADGQIHVGFLSGEMVAVGVIVRSKSLDRRASIGMFTKETHRRKGIGTSTILYLKRVCRDQNIAPISGCGYYNCNSKKTLQAAGMIPAGRLLRFEFDADT